MEDYEKQFSKFYSELFKFQSGKKSSLRCPGCESKKRFIIDNDKLTFACGPKTSENCGPQYTIELPKYIHFRTLHKLYSEQINGSFNYEKDNHLEYDLTMLSQKMDVKSDLNKQRDIVKEATDKLKRLIADYIKVNRLEGYIETLETLSEKRYKNSIEKKKIMRMINEDELSEPEKKELRRKYAVLIQENKEFIDIILELRKPNTEFIMTKDPKIIHHNKKSVEKEKTKKEDNKEDNKEDKITFDDQVKIIKTFYEKVDPHKTEEDIKRIINNRRPKGTPKGTRIPTKIWLDLCDKISVKYIFHPLRMKEEKDKFIEEQDDGAKILVDSLSPGSPR
jgi:hypothetical protein